VNADGKFVCEACSRFFDSIGALGGHKRFCDSGAWRCNWCKCKYAECSGKVRAPSLQRRTRALSPACLQGKYGEETVAR